MFKSESEVAIAFFVRSSYDFYVESIIKREKQIFICKTSYDRQRSSLIINFTSLHVIKIITYSCECVFYFYIYLNMNSIKILRDFEDIEQRDSKNLKVSTSS